MKWRLITLGLFLLLGAIINIAVAWGCVLNDPSSPSPKHWNEVSVSDDEWRDWRWLTFTSKTAFGRARARCHFHGKDARVRGGFGYRVPQPALEASVASWSLPTLPCPADDTTAMYDRIVDMSGWPCLALRSSWESKLANPDSVNDWLWRANGKIACPFGIKLSDRPEPGSFDQASPRILPLRPIWPGFAINTVFYVATLWLLFAAPFRMHRVIRRRLRIKRGVCPACAYPIGNSPVCTECGAAVQTRSP